MSDKNGNDPIVGAGAELEKQRDKEIFDEIRAAGREQTEDSPFIDLPVFRNANTETEKRRILELAVCNMRLAAEKVDQTMKKISLSELTPKVGVGIFVIVKTGDAHRVLLSRRKVDHGRDLWSLPGGHVSEGEAPEMTCRRELLEETGLVMTEEPVKVFFDSTMNEFGGKHYITLYYLCRKFFGDVQDLEPEKHTPWTWFRHDLLPRPLWAGVGEGFRLHSDILIKE